MKKKNIEGLEKMAADYLQYRYRMYLHSKRDADWAHYRGACAMIEAIGGDWRRHYNGTETEEDQQNPANYKHNVILPSDNKCEHLDFNAWEE